jgi:hypothetical protein
MSYPNYPSYPQGNLYPNLQKQEYPPYPPYQPPPKQPGNSLYDIFRSWDKNNDGTIDFYELAEILKSLGEDYSPDTVKAIMEAYDKDGNGVIDFYGNALTEVYFRDSKEVLASNFD